MQGGCANFKIFHMYHQLIYVNWNSLWNNCIKSVICSHFVSTATFRQPPKIFFVNEPNFINWKGENLYKTKVFSNVRLLVTLHISNEFLQLLFVHSSLSMLALLLLIESFINKNITSLHPCLLHIFTSFIIHHNLNEKRCFHYYLFCFSLPKLHHVRFATVLT